MQLSQKSHYALHALYALAADSGENPVALTEIARKHEISLQFLQVIMRELRNGGFVESRRGKSGGYLLARPARQIAVGEVIRFFEGELSPVDFIDGRGRPMGTHGNVCPFRHLLAEAAIAVNDIYDSYTIEDIVSRQLAEGAIGGPEYFI